MMVSILVSTIVRLHWRVSSGEMVSVGQLKYVMAS